MAMNATKVYTPKLSSSPKSQSIHRHLSAPASSTAKSTDDEGRHRGRHCVLTPDLRNQTSLEQEGQQLHRRSQQPSGVYQLQPHPGTLRQTLQPFCFGFGRLKLGDWMIQE